MNRQEFTVTPLPRHTLFTALALLLLPALALLLFLGRNSWLSLAVVAAIAPLFWMSLARRRVWLEEGQLHVVAGLNRSQTAISDLDIAAARKVRLDEQPQSLPGSKRFGTALPGYYAGHFRRGNGCDVFALVCGNDALILPRRDGSELMLSLARPQTLLTALEAAQSGSPAVPVAL